MKFDAVALQKAQRHAYDTLAKPVRMGMSGPMIHKAGANKGQVVKNPFYTPADFITTPATLVQEQAFVNSQNQYIFDFSQTAPKASSTLNNVLLGINNTFVIYGFQLLIGTGANANNRSYTSRGPTTTDDCIYNSIISIQFETGTLVNLMPGIPLREVGVSNTEQWAEMGMQLINPQRILTGRLGTFAINITLINSISALTLTANLFLSVRLWGVLGQASATN